MLKEIKTSHRDILLSVSILLSFTIVVIGSGSIISKPFLSSELGPANPACWELGNCNLFGDPLNAMLQPWTDVLGPITYVLIWGIILGVIWLRTHHTLLVGIIGVLIGSLYTYQGVTGFQALNNQHPNILLVGGGLLALSVCVVLYQLFFVRINYPQN